MAQPLRTVLVPAQSLAATAETFRYDLPVNPLSVILITLRCLNNVADASHFRASAAVMMSKIANVRVRYRGATIFDGDPLDLAMAQAGYHQWWPDHSFYSSGDNEPRFVTFALTFGRRAFSPDECFPATRRGDLVLEVETTTDPVGFDTYSMDVETVELLDASPSRFLKTTTTQFTLTSGDVNDISLPIGNKLLGLLLRAATFPTGATANSSFAEVALEVDNVEVMYSRSLWRALHAEWRRRTPIDWLLTDHTHVENIAASYTQTASTSQSVLASAVAMRYGWMDFDPLGDLSMALETKGAADINLHVNSQVTDTAPSRVIVCEYVEIGTTQAAS
jgi:hypothetical protein